MKKYDVIIVGAGMIGAALALALAQNNFSVCLIDTKKTRQKRCKK